MITVGEKLRILINKKNITFKKLADRTGQTPENISNKLKRNNFSERDIYKYAEALGCSVDIIFTIDETGEQL